MPRPEMNCCHDCVMWRGAHPGSPSSRYYPNPSLTKTAEGEENKAIEDEFPDLLERLG
jgi:hypothetical protein